MYMNIPKPEPILITRYEDLSIVFAGHEFVGTLSNNLIAGKRETRYADLCGKDIHKVKPFVGWYFIQAPVCMAAIDANGNTVAAAWCAPVRADNGQVGSNLSYAVDQNHEGRGLAKLLTAVAFLAHDLEISRNQFVNVQCRAENQGSTAIAQSFGMQAHQEGSFSVVLGKIRVPYHGFRMDPEPFREAALETISRRGLPALVRMVQAAYQKRESPMEEVALEADVPR